MASTVQSLKADTSLRGILILTVPISMSKLIPELNYLFNAGFLGELSPLALSMAGITGVYYLIFSAIGYGINNALLSIMSRRAGENNREEIFSTLFHGLILAFLVATATILMTNIGITELLRWAGTAEDGIELAAPYLKIRIWGLLFLFAMQMQNAYLISLQKSHFILIASLFAAVSNIVLDYGLIFGRWGMPELGFNGAAYASIISEGIGMLIVFGVIYGSGISKKLGIPIVFRFSKNQLALVTSQALPLMGQYAISTAAWWFFFILVARNYTVAEQGITQAMRNLFGLGGVFSWAFGSATNTIISNLIGQGRQDAVFSTIRKLSLISVGGMSLFVLYLNVDPSLFLGWFGQGGDFMEHALTPLRIVTSAMIILCFGVIWLNAVVATGKTKIVFWIEFIGIVLYSVYVYYVIEVQQWSLSVAWMSEWVYWIGLMLMSMLYLKFGAWREDDHLSGNVKNS